MIAIKNIRPLLSVLLTCALFSLPADASVNYKGISGLIDIPSAYVKRSGKGSVGYAYWRSVDAVSGNISMFGEAELAYSYWSSSQQTTGMCSIKLAILREELLSPALAAGVEDITNGVGRGYYLVVSKQLPWGLRLHTGYRGGKLINSLFCGVEKQIRLKTDLRKIEKFVPVFAVLLEHNGQDINYGVYIRTSRGLRFDLGWNEQRLLVGAQVEF